MLYAGKEGGVALVPAQPSHGADAHLENVPNTPGSRLVAPNCRGNEQQKPVRRVRKGWSLLSVARMTACRKAAKAGGKMGGAALLPPIPSILSAHSRGRRGLL